MNDQQLQQFGQLQRQAEDGETDVVLAAVGYGRWVNLTPNNSAHPAAMAMRAH